MTARGCFLCGYAEGANAVALCGAFALFRGTTLPIVLVQ